MQFRIETFFSKRRLKGHTENISGTKYDGNINKEGSSMTKETLVTLMEKNVKWYMVYARYT